MSVILHKLVNVLFSSHADLVISKLFCNHQLISFSQFLKEQKWNNQPTDAQLISFFCQKHMLQILTGDVDKAKNIGKPTNGDSEIYALLRIENSILQPKFHRHSVIRCMDMAMIQQRKVEKNIHTYINFIIDKHDQEIEACDEL
ncbi:hypothetical protein T01_15002 [Trichinella spiralis]|uniref:Uncharacterized protein n=1 Tax=Trichinella spiralis TaxID=6334 RepID=A0A0V1BGH3_TRISP|nr:hypothetical protein T01_15002 [Trichinella spiralis]